ncbi:MAG: endonuclease/exonuclease/phosphatase family protein [Fimbriimonadaceae bacterium]
MRDQGSTEFPEVKPKPGHSRIWLTLVFTYFALILVAFGLKFDSLAGITALPAIAWLVLGLFLSFLNGYRTIKRSALIVLSCFLAVGLVTAEEFYIPLRWLLHGREGHSIAYISLNCAGGDERAAREAVSRGAEVVFLQESPGKNELDKLAKEFGYFVVWGPDGSILTKMATKFDEIISEQDFVAIRQDHRVYASLRLMPPQFRLDYYSPELWKSQTENLSSRRDQLRTILKQIEDMRSRTGDSGEIVIAGDFNAVPGQISGREFGYHDLGATHGVNWGGSAVNEYPLARIDRVWLRDKNSIGGFHGRVVTLPTKFSDHRMVIVYK